MLFPDWGNRQNVALGAGVFDKSYTVPQDSFIIFYYDSEDSSPQNLTVNGQNLCSCQVGQLDGATLYPCFYCSKGTVIRYTSDRETAIFSVFPLVKSGGGLELAFIILSHPKANQRRRTYVIK